MLIIEERTGAGRKLVKDYFEKFDLLKKIGDSFTLPKSNRYEPKYIQLRLHNQARSYSKATGVEFKVQTRIGSDESITVMRNK